MVEPGARLPVVPREPCIDCTHDYCRCTAQAQGEIEAIRQRHRSVDDVMSHYGHLVKGDEQRN